MRKRSEGTIYTDKRGRLWAQLPRDPRTGRRPKRRARDQEHAVELLHQLHAERAQGVDPSRTKPTFAEFAEQFLTEIAEPSVEATTLAAYRALIEVHLNKRIGDTPIDTLQPGDCQKALNGFARTLVTGRDGTKRTRSQSQINECARLLKRILAQAMTWRLIPYNPAAGLTIPKGAKAEEIDPLTLEEGQKLLLVAEQYRNTALYHVALTLGLRRGELLGLRWSDVDYEAGTIAVRRQVNRLKGKNEIRQRTKNGLDRILPLTPALATQLRAHFAEQAIERQAAGADWREHGLIFPTSLGAPMTPQALNIQLSLILKRAKLRHITVHTMRHSVATWLDEALVTEAVIGAVLGHSRKATITRRYITARLKAMRAALEAHEITLRRAA